MGKKKISHSEMLEDSGAPDSQASNNSCLDTKADYISISASCVSAGATGIVHSIAAVRLLLHGALFFSAGMFNTGNICGWNLKGIHATLSGIGARVKLSHGKIEASKGQISALKTRIGTIENDINALSVKT